MAVCVAVAAGLFVCLPLFAQDVPVPSSQTVLIRSGQPLLVREVSAPWRHLPGALEGLGPNNYLYLGRALGPGDFSLAASLSIRNLAPSTAAVVINGDSYLGFEGAGGELFATGPIFGNRFRFLGPSASLLVPDRPFVLQISRRGNEVVCAIDGKTVASGTLFSRKLAVIAFRPWRSTMSIVDVTATGRTADLPDEPPKRTQPVTYTLPVVDISAETERQVIVESTPGQYLGHPTTVLLADGRTIFCTYPLGHGGPSAVLKRSDDGGLTWSERLPVPENWATATNCPCLHRLTGPDGVERLFVLEGRGRMRQSVSLDSGRTWTPFEPNGLHAIVAPITILPISGGRHLALYHRGQGDRDVPPLVIMQAISSDGGLTWHDERQVLAMEFADPCEPALLRSPDGRQLLCLMRENSRRYNSLMMVSDDEGQTWSRPVELPASLTGDRHLARYAPDGRLVCCFRDMAEGSPTKGDFVAWVGTYEDILAGREGQCRVRLLNSPVKGDLGYPGLEVLPDGTFVATTYAVLRPGEKQSVVSVRFKLSEVDEKLRQMPVQRPVFVSGTEGYHTFRIPAILQTPGGTLLAFCEGRRHGRSDTGEIDLVLRRSMDGGETWGPLQVIWHGPGNTCGNPCPVVDRNTGVIWLAMTHNLGEDTESQIIAGNSKGTRTVWICCSDDDGLTWTPPQEITATTKLPEWTWYATGPGVGIQRRSGRLIIPCDHVVAGSLAHGSHVIYSDDHGKSWHLGGVVGDTVNECQVVELADGSLLINMRNGRGTDSHFRAVSRSTDGGMTWSPITRDPALLEPVCQASLISLGGDELAFSNPASRTRDAMSVRLSRDGGKTWPARRLLYAGPAAYSCLCTLNDGRIGCLYERGVKHPYETIVFTTFSRKWLEDGEKHL
jgi:sialidase-1